MSHYSEQIEYLIGNDSVNNETSRKETRLRVSFYWQNNVFYDSGIPKGFSSSPEAALDTRSLYSVGVQSRYLRKTLLK